MTRIGSLCTGYGGLDLAVEQALDAETVWTCENDKHAARILEQRFGVPNHGDITTTDWTTVEPVDILTAGFPCQDVSHAGKRLGLRPGTRTGIWTHVAYAISILRPSLVILENVGGLLSADAHSNLELCAWCVGDEPDKSPLRALGAVLGDLAEVGYDARWASLRAADVGAPHGRLRVFIVAADADNGRLQQRHPDLGHILVTARGDAPPDAGGERHGRRQDRAAVGRVDGADEGPSRQRERSRPVAGDRGGEAAADADRGRLARFSELEPGREPRLRHDVDGHHETDWGIYASAIRRWERLTRPAPAPTEPGRSGPRLSPLFVEWLMGLPAGWVTDVDIPRNAQLKALGNGVVPQQAYAAVRHLLDLEAVAA